MALTYDGTNGLFTRLGLLMGLAEAVRVHQEDMISRMETIRDAYTAADAYMLAPLSAAFDARVQQAGSVVADVQAACAATLVETCYEDSLTSTRGVLPERTVEQALLYLNREMASDSETVLRTTVSKAAVTAGGSNVGNGTLVFSEAPPLAMRTNGTQYPNARTERIEVRCVQDAQDRAIRAGAEVFELRGWASFPNLDYRFPAGSGIRMRMPCVSAGVDAGARYENQLTNSGFERVTSNVPDSWTLVTGTAGTHVFSESSVVYRDAKALRFTGDGTVNPKLTQQLASTSGSPGAIAADRLYLLAAAVRSSAGITTGALRISLQDGSSTVLTGATFTVSGTAAGTTYTWNTVAFRAPLSLPSAIYATVETTTAISSGHSMYVDEVVLVELRQIAPGGIGVAVLAGSTNWVVDDALRILVTNNLEGKFNTEFDRMFDMYGKGVVLPNAVTNTTLGTPTISDTLIT